MARSKLELTVKDRLVLVNQYRILEALYPNEAEDFAKHRKAVEEGYTRHYGALVEWFGDELSEEACAEVADILELHSALHHSCKDAGVELKAIRFRGFDGNNETEQMAYTRYLLRDLGLWEELHEKKHDYNSHMPMLERYRAMVAEWKSLGRKFELTKNDIDRILT